MRLRRKTTTGPLLAALLALALCLSACGAGTAQPAEPETAADTAMNRVTRETAGNEMARGLRLAGNVSAEMASLYAYRLEQSYRTVSLYCVTCAEGQRVENRLFRCEFRETLPDCPREGELLIDWATGKATFVDVAYYDGDGMVINGEVAEGFTPAPSVMWGEGTIPELPEGSGISSYIFTALYSGLDAEGEANVAPGEPVNLLLYWETEPENHEEFHGKSAEEILALPEFENVAQFYRIYYCVFE